jgi:hypothetical protein
MSLLVATNPDRRFDDDPTRNGGPVAAWRGGSEAIGAFLATVPAGGALERFRLVPTCANGQPAFGCYLRDLHAPIARAYGLMVLTLAGDRVAAITGFPDTSVFQSFGLPRTLPESTWPTPSGWPPASPPSSPTEPM